MKKEYLKPEIEYVSFDIQEELLDDFVDGDMGTSLMPDDWE